MMQTTIELPDQLATQMQAIAETSNRPLAEVLTEAVAHYLEWDRWFRAQVEEGLRSAEAGHFVSPEEVEAMWDRLTTPEAMAEAEAELGPA
jgi:predicted transcriptional regulator